MRNALLDHISFYRIALPDYKSLVESEINLCVWVACASTLARVDGTVLPTGKSTYPCHPNRLCVLCLLCDLCGWLPEVRTSVRAS
jgi:hypothetical protein